MKVNSATPTSQRRLWRLLLVLSTIFLALTIAYFSYSSRTTITITHEALSSTPSSIRIFGQHAAGKLIAEQDTATGHQQFYEHSKYGICNREDSQLIACSVDEAIHSESLVHSAMLMHPFPRTVLVVGNEQGTIVREVLRYFTMKSVNWAIDEEKRDLFEQYLPYTFDDIINRVHASSFQHILEHHASEKYDVIIADVASTSLNAEFHSKLASLLNRGGVYAASAGPVSLDDQSFATFNDLSSLYNRVYSFTQFRPSHSALYLYHLSTNSDALMDPNQMHPTYVEQWLERRKLGELEYYDEDVHVGMFAGVPKWISKSLEKLESSPPHPTTEKNRNFEPHSHVKPDSIPDVDLKGVSITKEFFGADFEILSNSAELDEIILKGLSLSHASDIGEITTVNEMNLENVTGAADVEGSDIPQMSVKQVSFSGGHATVASFPHDHYAYASIITFNYCMDSEEFFGFLMGEIESKKTIGRQLSMGDSDSAFPEQTFYEFADGYYTNPKVQSRTSPTAGTGQFAIEDIQEGEVIFRGFIEAALRTDEETFIPYRPWQSAFAKHMSEQAEFEIFVSPRMYELDSSFFTNHNCDPNLWYEDTYDLMVARRNISKGEELTYDYATVDSDEASNFKCNCGSPKCRHTVRGTDWKLPHLQELYGLNHFYPHIRKKIVLDKRARSGEE